MKELVGIGGGYNVRGEQRCYVRIARDLLCRSDEEGQDSGNGHNCCTNGRFLQENEEETRSSHRKIASVKRPFIAKEHFGVT